jgi:hypothetical protein
LPPRFRKFPQQEVDNETTPSFISEYEPGDSYFPADHSRYRQAGSGGLQISPLIASRNEVFICSRPCRNGDRTRRTCARLQ